MGKRLAEPGGETPRPSQNGAGAPAQRRDAGSRQRETAARLERFAHTPGRSVSGRAGRSGAAAEQTEGCRSDVPLEGEAEILGAPGDGGGSPPADMASRRDHEEEGETQPTLKEVLAAVQHCNTSLTASLNILSSQVGSIQEGLTILRHDVQKIRERTAALEGRVSEIGDDMQHLQHDLGANTRKTDAAYDRTEDLENRLRRNNLRLVGVPEREEGSNATEFVERWLADKFKDTNLSPLFAVERAHRVPMRPPPPGNPPRAILARILNCRDRDVILRKARDVADLNVNGARVSIFPDFSSEIQKRRMRFTDVKRRLRALELPYAMLYPAKLRVVVDGEAKFFETAAGAAAWLDSNERRLRVREGRNSPR